MNNENNYHRQNNEELQEYAQNRYYSVDGKVKVK